MKFALCKKATFTTEKRTPRSKWITVCCLFVCLFFLPWWWLLRRDSPTVLPKDHWFCLINSCLRVLLTKLPALIRENVPVRSLLISHRFKDVRGLGTVKQTSWSEGENKVWDWGETCTRLARKSQAGALSKDFQGRNTFCSLYLVFNVILALKVKEQRPYKNIDKIRQRSTFST